MKWGKEKKEKIMNFIRADHVNAHGIRKGSATEATANTAEASLASIFHRGEWSLGIVLDIYWKYAQRGDQVLGRMLAGLSPESPDFDVLPPHFTVDESNEYLKKAMKVCFGKVIEVEDRRTGEGNNFVRGILMRCLASIIFHLPKIQGMIARVDGHEWSSLPLFLNNDQLLNKLKELVTTDPTPGICEKATGAATNTLLIKSVHKLINAFDKYEKERLDIGQKLDNIKEVVNKSVNEAIEEREMQNGNLTYQNFTNKLNEIQTEQANMSKTLLENAVEEMRNIINGGEQTINDNSVTLTQENLSVDSESAFRSYSHNGSMKTYYTPLGYDLSRKTSLRSAFEFWMNGDQSYKSFQDGSVVYQPVRPFLLWTVDNIPGDLWKKFNVGYAILKTCMESPSLVALTSLVKQKGGKFTDQEINQYYDISLQYILNRVEYIKNKNFSKWTVTTWSRNILRSSIMKHGTEEDKQRLPEETRYNQSHTGRKRKKKQSSHIPDIDFTAL